MLFSPPAAGREGTRLQVLGASALLPAPELAPCPLRGQRGQCGREPAGAVSCAHRTVCEIQVQKESQPRTQLLI